MCAHLVCIEELYIFSLEYGGHESGLKTCGEDLYSETFQSFCQD